MSSKHKKTYSLETLTDRYIGKKGAARRERFEFELKLELIGQMIKQARKRKRLTQEQLGELVGVKKAQVSKIETNARDVRLSTLSKVFEALNAKVTMSVELENLVIE